MADLGVISDMDGVVVYRGREAVERFPYRPDFIYGSVVDSDPVDFGVGA